MKGSKEKNTTQQTFQVFLLNKNIVCVCIYIYIYIYIYNIVYSMSVSVL